MTDPVMLDAGPLGRIAHSRRNPEINSWLQDLLRSGTTVFVTEISDYEVRRNFLAEDLSESLKVLDALQATLTYVPLTTQMMRTAAEYWADGRRAGRPTADPKELDCDVMLAAQAHHMNAIIATENVGHLSRYVTAQHWRKINSAR